MRESGPGVLTASRLRDRPKESRADIEEDKHSFDLLDLVFLIGAVLAPMDLTIFKSFTVYDLSVALLAFMIIAGPFRTRVLPVRFIAFAYVFLIAALISTFRATQPIEALTQVLQFAFIFFVQLPAILTVVRSRVVIRAGLAAFLIGNLITVLTAVVLRPPSGAGRLQTIFSDNANRLGAPTAYLLPFVLFFIIDAWRKDRKIVALTAGGVTIYLFIWALAASGSRGGAVATLVAILVFIVFRDVDRRPRRILRRVSVACVLIAALAFLVYRTDYLPSTLSERAARTFTPGDELANDRVDLDLAGLRAFGDSPFIGTGLDNFRFVGWRYGAPSDQAPHNLWIQFLAQVGVVGTAMILAFICGWFLLILRAHSAIQERSTRDLLWAFLASGTALMAIYLTAPVMVHRLYWLIFGLGMALALDLSRDRPVSASSLNHEDSGRWRTADRSRTT